MSGIAIDTIISIITTVVNTTTFDIPRTAALRHEQVEQNLAGLIAIAPDMAEDLLSAVDQPLKVQLCKTSGKEYLLCDYNRDGDSYR